MAAAQLALLLYLLLLWVRLLPRIEARRKAAREWVEPEGGADLEQEVVADILEESLRFSYLDFASFLPAGPGVSDRASERRASPRDSVDRGSRWGSGSSRSGPGIEMTPPTSARPNPALQPAAEPV